MDIEDNYASNAAIFKDDPEYFAATSNRFIKEEKK